MFFYICLIILFIPLFLIYPVRVIGRKNIPRKGKMILACNHQTNNDPIIIAFKLAKRRFRFMAKQSLFKYKISGAILKGLGAFPVNKSETDVKAVKTTLKFLKEEKALCIFPEGTRLTSDEQNSLKNGVAMFALKTGAPVVPTCFVKKTNAFVFNTLIVGKPIILNELEQFKNKKIDKELLDEASKLIGQQIYALKNNYLEKKSAKKRKKKTA